MQSDFQILSASAAPFLTAFLYTTSLLQANREE